MHFWLEINGLGVPALLGLLLGYFNRCSCFGEHLVWEPFGARFLCFLDLWLLFHRLLSIIWREILFIDFEFQLFVPTEVGGEVRVRLSCRDWLGFLLLLYLRYRSLDFLLLPLVGEQVVDVRVVIRMLR